MRHAVIIPIDATKPVDVRRAFGSAAYQGLFPRSTWIEAQGMCIRFDADASDETRTVIAEAMRAFASAHAPMRTDLRAA